jgi:hypothetical protein
MQSKLWEDAAELEPPRFSKRAVERSGKLLRGRIDAVDTEVLAAFEVAHNWRNAHVLPMRRLRAELSAKAKRVSPATVTAGRLKRMRSIRRKLARLPYALYQMQDIAGCRAIVPSIADLQLVIGSYERDERHEKVGGDDYLAAPKRGGYRSHHQIYRFVGDGEDAAYRHQLIEVQVRTQLQHAWATAVEAVGLVRGEDLKGGEGNADWLRFFELMSSEFAAEERCCLVAGVPNNAKERRQEILALNAGLNAVVNLDSYIRVIQTTERAVARSGQIFMIQYDPRQKSVDVRSFTNYAAGARRYEQEERNEAAGIDTVLVEVDRAADLRSAYPNYFLDVSTFLGRLRDVIEDRPRLFAVTQPTSPPVPAATLPEPVAHPPLVAPPPRVPGRRFAFDLDWWFNRPRR